MRRRWWIAAGVLLAVLAMTAYGVDHILGVSAGDDAGELSGWHVNALDEFVPLVGAGLVVLGLVVATATLAFVAGRHSGLAQRHVAPEADAPAEGASAPDTGSGVKRPAVVIAVAAALALVVGGALLVVQGRDRWLTTYTVAEIVATDNVAAVPYGPGPNVSTIVVRGIVPEVRGYPYDLALETLHRAGFDDVVVGHDGGDPEQVITRVSPEPGTRADGARTPVVVQIGSG